MKASRSVYLSGPITGVSRTAASNWRKFVIDRLAQGIVAVDPMRDAVDDRVISEARLDDAARLQHLLHGKEILERNRADIARCDLLLANFLEAERVSIGSVGEIFWADGLRKHVIVVREQHGNPHDHGMINAIAFATYVSLNAAIGKINVLLG